MRLLPSAISWRAFSIRPTASELLMSIRKIRDQISMACCRLPALGGLVALDEERLDLVLLRRELELRGFRGGGRVVGEALGGLRGEDRARGGRLAQHVRVLEACRGVPEVGRVSGRSLGSTGALGWRRRRRLPPRAGERAAEPGLPEVGRRSDDAELSSSSDSESSDRSSRPPPEAPSSGCGAAKPGFVDSPDSACGAPAGENCGAPSIRLSSTATAGWSGSRDRILSSAERASFIRWPSRAAMARWRATSNWGEAFFDCRAFSRISMACWFPGSTWSTCSADAIGGVEVAGVEALRGADEQTVRSRRTPRAPAGSASPRRRPPGRRRPRRPPGSWPSPGAAAPARTAGPSSG